jgi:serine O-acetyltransferase
MSAWNIERSSAGAPQCLPVWVYDRVESCRPAAIWDFAAMAERGDHSVEDRISAAIPDWGREQPLQFWDPGRKLLLALRRYRYWRDKTGVFAPLMRRWLVLRYRFWSIVTGADIPLNCDIGGGLLIPHPNGIVIHPAARIGVNCLVSQQVTVGIRDISGAPQIGGHVDIGAGAKILGSVHIGDHAIIGANAVVVSDVPSRATAVGIPARFEASTTPAERSRVPS